MGDPVVSDIGERVMDVVSDVLGINRQEVKPETSFYEDRTDSLEITELMMNLEDEFNTTIPEEQADKIKTVGDAIDYIEREQAKK